MGLVISGLALLQKQGLLPEILRLTFRKLHRHYGKEIALLLKRSPAKQITP